MTWQAHDAIADTSALLYLHLLDKLELFQALFARTIVPDAVWKELEAGARAGIDAPGPGAIPWAVSIAVNPAHTTRLPRRLGAGEREVLALAVERARTVVVLDDWAARVAARSLGLTVTGTLGILIQAKRDALVEEVRPLVDHIQARGFRIDPATRTLVLGLAGERE